MNAPWTPLEPALALQIVAWIYAIAVAVASLEYLSLRAEFDDRGAFSWRVYRASGSRASATRWLDAVQARVFGSRGVTALLCLQLACVAVILLAPPRTWPQWVGLALSTLVLLLLTARQRYGQDGADQMTLIVGITCTMTFAPGSTETAMQIGLWFLALQAVLAYLSAGIAKLVSDVWRRGLAVGLVVDTASYGSRAAGELLRRLTWMGRLLTWGTVVFELTFVLALIGPWQVTIALLVGGVVFHVGIAAVMGLNNFIPAFVSTYPAVLWASQAW